MMPSQASWLDDGRLHLHHGPIDLIIRIWGKDAEAGYSAAATRFQTVLHELAQELPRLRRLDGPTPRGGIARRMVAAVAPWTASGLTPMAAVAGAVADDMIRTIEASGDIRRAYVNNGGDVALWLAPGEALTLAAAMGSLHITAESPIRGVATSGWRGRSHSLGIADSVTVAARTAAAADAAATAIANAVDLPGHPAIQRVPASDLAPDSDLGSRCVTQSVGPLTAPEIETALARGRNLAQTAIARGLIADAALTLGQIVETVRNSAKDTLDA